MLEVLAAGGEIDDHARFVELHVATWRERLRSEGFAWIADDPNFEETLISRIKAENARLDSEAAKRGEPRIVTAIDRIQAVLRRATQRDGKDENE